MSEKLPKAISSATVTLLGVNLTVDLLDNGQRVIYGEVGADAGDVEIPQNDPAASGYTCCGPMKPITLPSMALLGPAAYICPNPDCKKWRHALPRTDTQIRALVVAAMTRLIAAGDL